MAAKFARDRAFGRLVMAATRTTALTANAVRQAGRPIGRP
jgi:hypothetical protein